MQDQEFYQKFKDYFLEVLELLIKESDNGKNIDIQTEDAVEFEGSGRISFGYVEKKDYARFIFRKRSLSEKLNTYQVCMQYLKDKKYIQDDIDTQGFLEHTLINFARDIGGFRFEEKKFEEIYKGIEGYISTALVNFSCSAQLFGFQSDTEEIIIDDATKIRKYSEEECIQAYKKGRYYRPRIFPISPSDFKLEVVFQKKKEDLRKSAGEGQKELREIVTLLRLFKSSTLRIGSLEVRPIQWVPLAGVTTYGTEERFGGSYQFNNRDLPEFKKLLSDIKGISLVNVYPLEIALKRFNYAHERLGLEDKLIDIMIGFETLYSGSQTEISYRISLGTSILTGKDLDERRKIFKLMQKAYKVRSDLVHGRKLESRVSVPDPVNKEFTMNEFVDLIKEHLSNSIKAFIVLSNTMDHKQILGKVHECSLATGML